MIYAFIVIFFIVFAATRYSPAYFQERVTKHSYIKGWHEMQREPFQKLREGRNKY